MAADGMTYESIYRRSELAIPALLLIVLAIFAMITAVVRIPLDGNKVMAFLPYAFGGVLLAIVFIGLSAFRVHRWTLEPSGVRIEERPKIPLTGLRRNATIAFSDIAALRRVQSGFDAQIEIEAKNGRRFRIAQEYRHSSPAVIGVPDPAKLEALEAAIRATAAAAGFVLPEREGLSFWNGPVGLFIQVMLLLFALTIAGVVLWTLFDGTPPRARPRMGEAEAIALLLPVGAAYLLYRSLKRRRAVLKTQRG
jgi:hypothetical protein